MNSSTVPHQYTKVLNEQALNLVMLELSKGEKDLKLNIIGLIAAILAFICIALPWWQMTISVATPISISYTLIVNLYGISIPGLPTGSIPLAAGWYMWAALAFIALGGLLGLVGSFLIGKMGKNLLGIAGILTILSPIIFAAGLSGDLSSIGWGLFYSGKYMGVADLSAMLSYGFFLAIVAAILLFIAMAKHPMEAEAVSPPPPQ